MRSKTILTTAAILALSATPASAVYSDVQAPPSSAAEETQDLRMPDTRDAAAASAASDAQRPYVLERDYGSPDAVDAARDLPPVQIPAPVLASAEPASGFDWGDAGFGAAGMLALLSIAAGSALLLTGRKRRNQVRVATH